MQRRQGTVRFKTKAGGEPAREALLETKTHRRVNRRQVRHFAGLLGHVIDMRGSKVV